MKMINNEVLNVSEKVKYTHSGTERTFNSGESKVVGNIKVKQYLDENQLFETWSHNTLTIYGGLYMAEKFMNRRIPFDTETLDKVLKVITDPYTMDDTTVKDEVIVGLICGNAPIESVNAIMPGKRQSKVVNGLIPYRVLAPENDLTGEDRKKYFMRVVRDDGKIAYYGKRFSSHSADIKFDNGTEVPLNIYTNTGFVNNIDVFNKFIFNINTLDFREYYLIKDGNTKNCAINNIGLVTGVPVDVGSEVEYKNLRCITIANTSNLALSGVGSTLEFEYHLLYR